MSHSLCSIGHNSLETVCCGCSRSVSLSSCNSASHCRGTVRNGKKAVYIVTGGNRGVGYYTVKVLLQQGHTVYLLSRNLKRGEKARESLIARTKCRNESVILFAVDLSNSETIKAFLKTIRNDNSIVIRGLVNNAGIIGDDSLIVNHIGHYALTVGLLSKLREAADVFGSAYITNVSSVASWEGSTSMNVIDDFESNSSKGWTAYAASKAGKLLAVGKFVLVTILCFLPYYRLARGINNCIS